MRSAAPAAVRQPPTAHGLSRLGAGRAFEWETRRLTGITKAGSIVARRLVVEAAWPYRIPAQIGPGMQSRQETLPMQIRDIAWNAQVWLSVPGTAGCFPSSSQPSPASKSDLSGRSLSSRRRDRFPERTTSDAAARASARGPGILQQFWERQCRSLRVRPRQPNRTLGIRLPKTAQTVANRAGALTPRPSR